MNRAFHALAILAVLLSAGAAGRAAEAPVKALVDFSAAHVEQQFTPTSAQVTVSRSDDPTSPGLVVKIAPGPQSYPGVDLKPESGPAWDLSAYGHVSVQVTNTGDKAFSCTVRVDNPGDWQQSPWNAENVGVKPGKTATVTVYFGYSWGHEPGYALKPAEISEIKIFTSKVTADTSFRIDSIEAGGSAGEKPPIDPNSIRNTPAGGIIVGPGVTLKAGDVTARHAQASVEGDRVQATFPAPGGEAEQSVTVKPTVGRWDLRDDLQVTAKLKNTGKSPITPSLRVESNSGPTDAVAALAPIAPGEEESITASFIAAVPWQGPSQIPEHGLIPGLPGTGTRFSSDAVSGVTVLIDHAAGGDERSLQIESIVADAPPAPAMPNWLGQRPPVAGDWTKTFDDEFDGPALDASKWNIYGDNFWDRKSHFSKDEVIVANGTVTLRFEKKTGHQNDDPNNKRVTNYAVGYLDTYGKWAQRYGYFEARMKLPTASGMWPAFWMMPDRGGSGPQWTRQSTADHGMEFDIMEYLSCWGPFRYNIAMHWDGYKEKHKATGSEYNYVQPDKDGFITSGLLWTPGSAVFYCNGREIAHWENPRISDVPSDLMFTMPTGGWQRNPLIDSELPASFVIDYVRVWQRKDLASPTGGKPAASTP